MLSPQEHAKMLQVFDLEHLLHLLAIEAKASHDGHYTIFSSTTGYKVALGTPEVRMVSQWHDRSIMSYIPQFETLKQAVMYALVSKKSFDDYDDAESEHEAQRIAALTLWAIEEG